MQVGDTVRVLPPFAESFPGLHVITDVQMVGDVPVYILGDAGAIDAKFLEPAA